MNLAQKRRAKSDPAKQQDAEAEARRQIAVAVSTATKKAREETRNEVLEAIAEITGSKEPLK